MWKDFNVEYPTTICLRNIYHSLVSDDMNIGFNKLGDKRYEIYLVNDTTTEHNHDCNEKCDDCSQWRCHVARAEKLSNRLQS